MREPRRLKVLPLLAFVSSQNPARQNSQLKPQLFVAVLALDADTPTPTQTPTPTPAPPVLSEDIGSTDLEIFLNDARALPDAGTIQIDGELIVYNGRSNTVLFVVTRGACGTIAAMHHAGASVSFLAAGCPATPSATSTPIPPTPGACIGDCDHNGKVAVDELVKGVNIALGNAALDDCPAFDCNGNARVTIDCLVKAVNAALDGCQ